MSIPPVDRAADLPLSFNQEWQLQSYWALAQAGTPARPMRVTRVLRVAGALDERALRDAVNQVVARHEVLRTGFLCRDRPAVTAGQPAGVSITSTIETIPDVPVAVVDLQQTRADERDAALEAVASRFLDVPVRFDRPPHVIVALARLAPAEHVLLVMVPRLIADPWAVQNACNDLEVLYARAAGADVAPLPAVLQNVDFAAWERAQIEGPRRGELVRHWCDRWRAWHDDVVSVDQLPQARTRSSDVSLRAGLAWTALDEPASHRLRAFARAARLTPAVLGLTAFYLLLAAVTGRRRVAAWVRFANRSRVELEPVVGWLATAHIVGTDLTADPSALDACRQVRDLLMAEHPHQQLPWPLLWNVVIRSVRAGRPSRPLSALLDSVTFDARRVRASAPGRSGVSFDPVLLQLPTSRTNFDITLIEQDQGLGVRIGYPPDRLDPKDVRAMLASVVEILRLIAEAPDLRVSHICEIAAGLYARPAVSSPV